MGEEFFDQLMELRLAERRVDKLNKKTKQEGEEIYDKIVEALMDGDKEAAKDYARMYLKLKRKRKIFRQYISQIKEAKLQLKEALATKNVSEKLRETTRVLSKMKNASSIMELMKFSEKLKGQERSMLPMEKSVGEEKVSDVLKGAKAEASTETEEILPEIPDRESLEEYEEKRKEKEE